MRRTAPRAAAKSVTEAERPHAMLAQKAAVWLFGATVIGSALAIGTVHATTLLIVAAATFTTLALALYGRPTPLTSLRPSLPVAACAALALYTLLQALPMPMGLLRVIAPANADVWERVLLPFGEAPIAWASLSLDPGATVLEALKWATYAATFASASAISAKRGAAFGVTLVFSSAMLLAVVTVAHGLVGATKVYGLYQPLFAGSVWHIGPLLNPNNLAGYLNLGALAGLGLALTRKPVVAHWLMGVGVMLIVGVEVTSASRGGVLALLIGVAVLAVIMRRQGKSSASASSRSRPIWIILGAAVVGGAGLAVLGSTGNTWTELYAKDASKLEMLLWTRPLLHDHPFFGIGRGAFESVFPVYRLVPGNIVFTHAENFPAQWASEWGIPVTLAAFIAFGWAFAPRKLGVGRSSVAAGAWLGVAVLLLQNMFDLALEIPAICIAVMAVLGSLWGDRRRHHLPALDDAAASRDHRFPLAIAVAATGLALVGLGALVRTNDVAGDRAAIHAAYEEGSDAVARARGLVRAAMLRHPAEPYFPLMGAMLAVRAHDQSPMPWLQHTLERGQVNGRAHLLLATFLGSRGAKKQALFETRLSVENDGQLAGPAANLALQITHDYDDLITAVPEGKPGLLMLGAVAATLGQGPYWPTATRCNQEIIARDPGDINAHLREAEARLSALTTGKPAGLCVDTAACHESILAHADVIARMTPAAAMAPLLRARLLLADGKADDAARLLEVACQSVADRLDCLRGRFLAAAAIKDIAPSTLNAPNRFDSAAKELIGNGCATPLSCADTSTWIGDIRRNRGEIGLALAMYERAARADPTEARWLRLADVASAVDEHARAADALAQIAQRHGGGDPELRTRILAERKLAGSRLLPR